MPWFRLYNRIVDDEKLRLLAFEDRWHFVALCALKASGLLDEPDSDMRTRKVAVKLGVQVRELDEIARRLSEVGLIDDRLNPLAWDELQFRSDNSTSRVQAYRKRQQNQARNKPKQQRNVSVTVQETETETELEPKGSCASGDAPLTVDEVVSDWNELATQCGLPKVRKLTPERRRKLNVRLREYPDIADWQRAFQHIRNTPFLRGENRTGWRANFKFLLQAESFANLTEEAYGQASGT